MTVANFLAIYACMFEFFRDANFPAAPRNFALGAVALPVLGFLGGCVVRRRQVFSIIHARRIRELEHLPRITGWLLGALAVGAASFALPRLELDPLQQGIALLAAMALITLFVVASVRDVILVMIDIAMVFEGVAARLDRLVRPMMAFVTFYALLVVVFACLYRIADLTTRDAAVLAARGAGAHQLRRCAVLQRRHDHHAGLRRHRAGLAAGAGDHRDRGAVGRADAAVRLQRDHAQRRRRTAAAARSAREPRTEFRHVPLSLMADTGEQ